MAYELKNAEAPNWISWVTDFDKAAKNFLDSWHYLKSTRPWVIANAPQLLAQHDKLMQEFLKQAPMLDQLAGIRSTVISWLNSIGNFFRPAVDWVKGTFGLGDAGLGIAPVVWIGLSLAAASGALVTVSGLIAQANEHDKRLRLAADAIARGATPEQAAATVNAIMGKPASEREQTFLGLPVQTLVWGVAAVVIVPPLLQLLRERKS